MGIFFSLLKFDMSFDLYLIPLCLCGIMSLCNVVKYLFCRDFYKNVYLVVWIVLFINSFVAPLIHFAHDFWVENLPFCPTDWSDYAFLTSSFYFVGMLIFHVILTTPASIIPYKSVWVAKKSASVILFFLFVLSFLVQIYIYAKMGGIVGYIANFTNDDEEFVGLGKYFLFSELGPFLYLIYFIIRNKDRTISGKKVFWFVVVFLVLALFFGGLRGSRSNTLFTLIQGILTIHLLLYRFNLKHLFFFVIFFFVFMYVGRLYKDQGINVVDVRNAVETRQALTKNDLSQVETILIGDLSRYGINAYEISRLLENPNYNVKWGQTYLWGILTFVPLGSSIIDSFDIKSRNESAEELMYGKNTSYRNSRIFGLLGEWLLNFGMYVFFIPYVIMGFIIKRMRVITLKISQSQIDIRMLMIPVMMVFVPILILSDSSNIMFFFLKRVFIFYLILWLVSNKKVLRAI